MSGVDSAPKKRTFRKFQCVFCPACREEWRLPHICEEKAAVFGFFLEFHRAPVHAQKEASMKSARMDWKKPNQLGSSEQ
jgi:hypothetical protein